MGTVIVHSIVFLGLVYLSLNLYKVNVTSFFFSEANLKVSTVKIGLPSANSQALWVIASGAYGVQGEIDL